MNLNKEIAAFTLSEMIVVLILTSVVVALAFSALNLVQKHMLGIQQNYSNNNALNSLELSLWVDFNRYQNIRFNATENALRFTSEIDSTHYVFYDSYIVKKQDTFHISLQKKEFYFLAKIINEGFLDAIKLETTKALQNQQLFIYKLNDASVFMK